VDSPSIDVELRFSLEELQRLRDILEQLRREREEKYRQALEEAWKLLEKIKEKKPRKKIIPVERPVLTTPEYVKWREVYEKLIEEEKYPEWILEELKKETELRYQTKKFVIEFPSVVIEEIRRGLFPYVKKVVLRGVTQEWHEAYIMPFVRNMLERLRATKEKWRESEHVHVKMRIGDKEMELDVYAALVPIGHLFYSSKPFLYCVLPISHPAWRKATVKAVLIFNPHDEPLKLHIVHLHHGTEDEVEIPPKHILLFVHEFRESLEILERKAEAKKWLEEKIGKLPVSEELRKRLEKIYWELIKKHEYKLPEEIYEFLREKAKEKLLREFFEQFGHILREVKREWILV